MCVLLDICCMALVSENLSMSCAALQTLVLLSDFLNHVKIRPCYQLHEADNASYLLRKHDPWPELNPLHPKVLSYKQNQM